uniref:Uncharacterized protein n=1 Tax=Candidatus Kentrum sp. UNK TaxID=2126344 RepID=A0A451AYY4_9GAMM|nr:MAG: hypothetical protein BECKUNK1418G_GA0071005_105117 [Candidatus Kentron sp. UNK]VFK71244.1 MAG: hypothetical protein BECKUNK1418H_GA0071006_105617 [Candidatus Kentron sp. UNK]
MENPPYMPINLKIIMNSSRSTQNPMMPSTKAMVAQSYNINTPFIENYDFSRDNYGCRYGVKEVVR